LDKIIEIPAKAQFGIQLDRYINASGLTQEEFASYMQTGAAYIRKILKGKTSVGIDILEKYALFFGVQYYEMCNPKFPIPSFESMPATLRNYVKQMKSERLEKKGTPRQKLAPFVDDVLATNFLKTAKTADEFAEHIKYKVTTEPGKISVLLTSTKRNKIVRTIPGKEWGGTVNKYILISTEET
jgi:transcriptional regulator with XRE-family HTH domain